MPIHDWTRVDAGVWHDFHLTWIGELKKVLNSGLLPDDYYALAEQIAGPMGPDVLTLQTPSEGDDLSPDEPRGMVAVADAPPKVRFTMRPDVDQFVLKRRTLVIRHVSGHRVVALIELISPGNKAGRNPFRSFVDKSVTTLAQGIQLLIVDLFPPGPRDPQGIHNAVWKRVTGLTFDLPPDKRLTLVAYSAGPVPVAYVEPVAVGDVLPDMPLFLDPNRYVYVPLESTYRAAYESVPRFYRAILESARLPT
jgi:hypothetical protein